MCTYATLQTTLEGSAKGPHGKWFRVTDGTVYFDHPVHAQAEHTLNIDFADPAGGPGARVAVELTAASARNLAAAIHAALASAPPELREAACPSAAVPEAQRTPPVPPPPVG